MEVAGFIYLLRNKSNGKVYIGQTVGNIRQRWSEHKSHAKRGTRYPIYHAIRKYGPDAFDIIELHRAYSFEELDEMEVRAIWSHDSTNSRYGYNITAGGGGVRGYIASPETKAKIAAKSKSRWSEPDFREKVLSTRLEVCASPEYRAAQRKRTNSFCHTPEYKQKHCDNSTEMWKDPAYRQRHAAAMTAASSKPDYRTKQSASGKARWQDPAFRERMMAQRRDPAYRAKLANSMRARNKVPDGGVS